MGEFSPHSQNPLCFTAFNHTHQMPRQPSNAHSIPKEDPRREWLIAKYPSFLEHQANKTAGQFFPSLYEEFFSKWEPTPTVTGGEGTWKQVGTCQEH